MPENAVYVGRPTKWGNPFKVGVDGDLEEVLRKFRKDLACWCPLMDKRGNKVPCHADIILEMMRNG